MKFRLPLGLCAMIATCVATGSLLDLVPTSSPAWNYGSIALTYAVAAFVGGAIARRRFVLVASLLTLLIGAGLVAILTSIGGDPLTTLRHPLFLSSIGCALLGAVVGAWSGQRFAVSHAARAAAASA